MVRAPQINGSALEVWIIVWPGSVCAYLRRFRLRPLSASDNGMIAIHIEICEDGLAYELLIRQEVRHIVLL